MQRSAEVLIKAHLPSHLFWDAFHDPQKELLLPDFILPFFDTNPVSQRAQAVVTKYHTLNGLDKRNLFSQNSGSWDVQGPGAG